MKTLTTKLLAAALTVAAGGAALARPPAPAGGPLKLFDGEHKVLAVAAKGRVVFSPDGKRLAYLAGGKIYVAETQKLAKDKAAKGVAVADADAKWPFLDGQFLPGADGPLVAVTAKGLTAVGPDMKANKAAALDLPDARSFDLSPDGKRLAAGVGKDVRVLPVGGKKGPAVAEATDKALRGTSFGSWSDDSQVVYAVKGDTLDVLRVEAATGKSATVISGADLAKTCGVALGKVEVRAARGAGAAERVFLVAWQKAPAGKFAGTTLYDVPKGAKERGRNPGSAEPGPEPPSWALLVEGGKPTVIDVIWKARWMDDVLVEPSKKLDKFFFAQMAQAGGAGDGRDPEVWLGTIDAKGKKTEKKLPKGAFPENLRDLNWQVLDVSDDATKALVLVTADLPVKKKADGPLDLANLAAEYGRAGATMDGKFAVLKFQSWSLWSFDASKGTVKRLTKLYAEKVDDLKKETVGLEGKLGTFTSHNLAEHVAYSRRAGVVALSLNAQTVFTGKKEMLKPVVLIRVPKW